MDERRGNDWGIAIGVEMFNHPSYNLISILLGVNNSSGEPALMIGKIYTYLSFPYFSIGYSYFFILNVAW